MPLEKSMLKMIEMMPLFEQKIKDLYQSTSHIWSAGKLRFQDIVNYESENPSQKRWG